MTKRTYGRMIDSGPADLSLGLPSLDDLYRETTRLIGQYPKTDATLTQTTPDQTWMNLLAERTVCRWLELSMSLNERSTRRHIYTLADGFQIGVMCRHAPCNYNGEISRIPDITIPYVTISGWDGLVVSLYGGLAWEPMPIGWVSPKLAKDGDSIKVGKQTMRAIPLDGLLPLEEVAAHQFGRQLSLA